MLQIDSTVREVSGIHWRALPDALLHAREQIVLSGLVADWPPVQAGRQSTEEGHGDAGTVQSAGDGGRRGTAAGGRAATAGG